MGRGWTVKLLQIGRRHEWVGAQGAHGEELAPSPQVKVDQERLVRRLLEEQDTIFRCYYAAKWGGQQGQGGRQIMYRECSHRDMGRE